MQSHFPLEVCRNCPYYDQCRPVEYKCVATIKVAMRIAFHVKQQRFLQIDEFHKLTRFRNGIETVLAALQKRHHVDKILGRGYIEEKLFLALKL